jgi:hypothetical protein
MEILRALGLASVATGAIGGSLDTGSVLLIVGAVVFAIATWRSRSPQILRNENADLRDRNETLYREVTALKSENQILHAQPNLERLAGVLSEMQDVNHAQLELLKRLAVAVIPPE